MLNTNEKIDDLVNIVSDFILLISQSETVNDATLNTLILASICRRTDIVEKYSTHLIENGSARMLRAMKETDEAFSAKELREAINPILDCCCNGLSSKPHLVGIKALLLVQRIRPDLLGGIGGPELIEKYSIDCTKQNLHWMQRELEIGLGLLDFDQIRESSRNVEIAVRVVASRYNAVSRELERLREVLLSLYSKDSRRLKRNLLWGDRC